MVSTGPDDQSGTQSSGVEFLFEHTTDCIVEGSIQNGDPIVHRVNDAFESVFGYTNSELRGENLNDFITPDGKRDEVEAVDQAIREGDIGPREVTRQTADGPRDFLLRATGGEGELSFAIYTDITAQKEREQELRRQNERLEEFVSVVSHDLRNPLNVAALNLELVADECDSPYVQDVVQAHTRMESLIDDLLQYARVGSESLEREHVPLGDLIGDCWETIQSAEATLAVETERVIQADRNRLRQLFKNLLMNAITHSRTGVSITIGELEEGFYVEDDGPGIPEEERTDVFKAGYSSHEDGTGFGLSIVKQVAEAHGWNIRVTDGKSGGARFEITAVEFVE